MNGGMGGGQLEQDDVCVRFERQTTPWGPALVISIAGELDMEGVEQLHAELPPDLDGLIRPSWLAHPRPNRTGGLRHAADPHRDAGAETSIELAGAITSASPVTTGPWPALVVLDLAQVPFLDSSGTGALLAFHRRLGERGTALAVCCLQPQPRQVLTLTATDRILKVLTTKAEALAQGPTSTCAPAATATGSGA